MGNRGSCAILSFGYYRRLVTHQLRENVNLITKNCNDENFNEYVVNVRIRNIFDMQCSLSVFLLFPFLLIVSCDIWFPFELYSLIAQSVVN